MARRRELLSSHFPTVSPTLQPTAPTPSPSRFPTFGNPTFRPSFGTSSPTSLPTPFTYDLTLNGVVEVQYTGYPQEVYIPANLSVTEVAVYLWGAGGHGRCTSAGGGQGGSGAYVEGILSVQPGSTLVVVVGEGGRCSGDAYGGGGRMLSSYGGGGGGRSAIQLDGEDLVTAGGGGGLGGTVGGSSTSVSNNQVQEIAWQGGNQAMSTACVRRRDYDTDGGGGSVTQGGEACPCHEVSSISAGQRYQGGTSGAYGGGGGGGYYGGGGGRDGGGGGGSSYLANLRDFWGSQSGPLDGTCAGLYSLYYLPTACGRGLQESVVGAGKNGRVVIELLNFIHPITANPTTYPTTLSPTLFPTLAPVRTSSAIPTSSPTTRLLTPPTLTPTQHYFTRLPTSIPTRHPTSAPTSPTSSPTQRPTWKLLVPSPVPSMVPVPMPVLVPHNESLPGMIHSISPSLVSSSTVFWLVLLSVMAILASLIVMCIAWMRKRSLTRFQEYRLVSRDVEMGPRGSAM